MKKTLLAVAITLAAAPAFAEIDPIVIEYNSSRLGLTNETTGRSITVFDQGKIQSGAYTSLVDVVEKAAGISMAFGPAKSQNGHVRIRNGHQSRVLIILNGMPLKDGTNNYADLSRIALASVSRIEVVKGNVAAQFGRRATAGVIFIETQPETASSFVEAKLGSFNTWGLTAGTSQESEYGVLSAQINRTDSAGFDTRTNATNTDRDGYTEESVQLGFTGSFGENSNFRLIATKEQGLNEFDNGTVANDNNTFSAQFETFNPLGTLSALASIADYEAEFTGFSYESKFQGKRLELTQTLPVFEQSLIGLEWLEEDNFGSAFEEDLATRDLSLFAESSMSIANTSVSAALRKNDSNQFGDDFSWSISSIRTSGTIRPFLNLGQAELKPSPLQLNGYESPDGTSIPGNPNLVPETSTDLEVGFATNANGLETRFALFGSEIDDQINNGSDNVAASNQIGKTDRYGFEAQASFSLSDFEHSVSVTRAVTETLSGAQNLQLPEFSAQYSVSKQFGQTYGEVTLDYESDRSNWNASAFNTERVLTSISIARSIQNWDLSAKIDNLFDEEWEPTPTYRGTPRSVNLVARYNY